MANDRAAMIAEMEDEMDRSDTTAFQNKITAAITAYQGERFWFNESRSVTFPTVAGTSDYSFTTIGTVFYKIDACFSSNGTDEIELGKEDYLHLEALLGNTSSRSRPTMFGYINSGLRLYANPDAVYTMRLLGHIKIAAPASDGEASNAWMVDAYDLIKARAKRLLFAQKYRDLEGAQIEGVIEDDAYRVLKAKTADKIGTGSIRPTQF